jgi:hypothetical protein
MTRFLFILEPSGIARSLAHKRVTVIDYPDGRLAIRYHGVDLPYRTFDKRPLIARMILDPIVGPAQRLARGDLVNNVVAQRVKRRAGHRHHSDHRRCDYNRAFRRSLFDHLDKFVERLRETFA